MTIIEITQLNRTFHRTDHEVKKLMQSALVPNKEVLKTIQEEHELSTCFTNTVDSTFECAMSDPTQLMNTTKGIVFGVYNAVTRYFKISEITKMMKPN